MLAVFFRHFEAMSMWEFLESTPATLPLDHVRGERGLNNPLSRFRGFGFRVDTNP